MKLVEHYIMRGTRRLVLIIVGLPVVIAITHRPVQRCTLITAQ